MARQPPKPSTGSKLANAPRGNANSQASGNNANTNVGRKSASLVGMEHWAQLTHNHFRFRNQSLNDQTNKTVSDRAYKIYQRNALHNELLGQNDPLEQPRDDMTGHDSRLRGNNVSGLLLKARNNNKQAKEVYFEDSSGNRGNYNDQTSNLFVTPDDKNIKGRLDHNTNISNANGFSVRMSLTSDAFFDAKGSGVYADNNNKRKKVQKAEFTNLASAALSWATNEDTASGAKVMGPKMLNKGRTDHAVLYGTSRAGIEQKAQQYSRMLAHPSQRSPLGMEPLAPGVSYGETLNHTHSSFAPGYNNDKKSAGNDSKTLSSFGTSRANIIADAVKSHAKNNNNNASLNTSLRNSLGKFGYNVTNPARVNVDNPAVVKHLTSQHSSNNNSNSSKRNQTIHNRPGNMASAQNSK